MKKSRDQVLARPALSLQQHRKVTLARALDLVPHLEHRCRLAEDNALRRQIRGINSKPLMYFSGHASPRIQQFLASTYCTHRTKIWIAGKITVNLLRTDLLGFMPFLGQFQPATFVLSAGTN